MRTHRRQQISDIVRVAGPRLSVWGEKKRFEQSKENHMNIITQCPSVFQHARANGRTVAAS